MEFWIYIVAAVGVLVLLAMWLLPIYGVWAAGKTGDAALAEAHGEQRMQVAQARGRVEAATLNKQAEIIDAEAVAKSIEIISNKLKGNHGYLQWQWIKMMENRNADADTIYVPTEAGLPILEAGKRRGKS